MLKRHLEDMSKELKIKENLISNMVAAQNEEKTFEMTFKGQIGSN